MYEIATWPKSKLHVKNRNVTLCGIDLTTKYHHEEYFAFTIKHKYELSNDDIDNMCKSCVKQM